VKAVIVPTSAAPTGPSKTTDANVADVLGVQEIRWGARMAGADSQMRNSSARTTRVGQEMPLNGPSAMTTAPQTTTAPM
jgi:hypothetical protein